MPSKKTPKSRKKALKKVSLKPIKTLKPLTLTGISGESTSSGYQGWIEVNSFDPGKVI